MTTTRRAFLTAAAATIVTGAVTSATAVAADVRIQAQQRDWRFCDKCYGMFFDGYANKGLCPAGGGHRAQGWNFQLPYDMAEDNWNQRNWRYCERCHGMFFDGNPGRKGVCPIGDVHKAQGWNFTLPHNYFQIPRHSQPGWAFCQDCWGLFFNGYPSKGVCPVPGPHVMEAGSYRFELPYLP